MSKDASKNTEPMDEELKDKVPETPETETVPETEAAAPAPEPTAEEKLQAQLSELNDRYLRTLAEYDNYRKRTAIMLHFRAFPEGSVEMEKAR